MNNNFHLNNNNNNFNSNIIQNKLLNSYTNVSTQFPLIYSKPTMKSGNFLRSSINPQFKISIKHKINYPSNYFFSNVKNQYYVESRVNETHQFTPISSFEEKLNNEMKRISHRYGKPDSRQIFYPNINNHIYWRTVKNFDQYKTLKMIENRFEGEKINNLKHKLKPLIDNEEGSLDNLSKNLFYFDRYNKRVKIIEKNIEKKKKKNKILKKNSFVESKEIDIELKNDNNNDILSNNSNNYNNIIEIQDEYIDEESQTNLNNVYNY